MPLHITVNKSKPEPNSKNCDIPKEWFPVPVVSENSEE
jgi:hypothetical protein